MAKKYETYDPISRMIAIYRGFSDNVKPGDKVAIAIVDDHMKAWSVDDDGIDNLREYYHEMGKKNVKFKVRKKRSLKCPPRPSKTR